MVVFQLECSFLWTQVASSMHVGIEAVGIIVVFFKKLRKCIATYCKPLSFFYCVLVNIGTGSDQPDRQPPTSPGDVSPSANVSVPGGFVTSG